MILIFFAGDFMKFIDLSHYFEEKMPGFRMKNKDGAFIQYTAHIRPFLTHEQSLPLYGGKASFEISEIYFQTSIGTYLDSPYHRFPAGRDISEIAIDEVVLKGIVINVQGKHPFEPVGPDVMPKGKDLRGKAVLFNFGWDRFWGTEEYYTFPYIDLNLIEYLISAGVKLVGVDTLNIDNPCYLARPAHTNFLQNQILIIENLTGLEQLHGADFKFYAVPLKARRVAALPVRAFAEVL